ncbi:ABC transporter ATP-binding protein [Aquamicrobium sp. LC103]|uniref:ABC transporter ATP-binding protein n=1 Tax=Aquamicrobium sp. LC103 TaxID=1120658 RepID=UPI00063E73A5|nr:ABC transporter ATP-binding protein [Aquamicrobium sp. LC103]TKT79149.1 ABC transporter ATP-binding protein [Aquamicrobium sp. LC103]
MANISIQNVYKNYGSLNVLKEFSLEIEDGEFVVLVGPSGCGKSTMLKILAGLEPASGGRIFIGGREMTDLAPGDRDIAMVFQNYALYPHLTVAENIGFGLKMRKVAKKEIATRIKDAAKILAIENLLQRRPKELSGGQRQRVALGRAIVREPQAFLMDEPLSNLDAKLRVHMRAEISALHQRLGVTTIYVTHDQIEAMTMADRVVIMKDGVIQQIADPDTLFRKPANLFVAGFMGSPGMNFVSARQVDGKAEVELLGQAVPVDADPGKLSGAASSKGLIAGIRPEYIKLGDGPLRFEVKPTLVESLGSEQYVYFSADEHAVPAEFRADDENRKGLIARVQNAAHLGVGEAVTLSLDPARIHLFDAASGKALN